LVNFLRLTTCDSIVDLALAMFAGQSSLPAHRAI